MTFITLFEAFQLFDLLTNYFRLTKQMKLSNTIFLWHCLLQSVQGGSNCGWKPKIRPIIKAVVDSISSWWRPQPVPVVVWQHNMHPWAWLADVSLCWIIHLTDCIREWSSSIHDTLGSHVKFFTSYDITYMGSTHHLILFTFFCKEN